MARVKELKFETGSGLPKRAFEERLAAEGVPEELRDIASDVYDGSGAVIVRVITADTYNDSMLDYFCDK